MSLWSYLPRFPWTQSAKEAASLEDEKRRRTAGTIFLAGLGVGSFFSPFSVLFLFCLLVVVSRPEAQAMLERKAAELLDNPSVKKSIGMLFPSSGAKSTDDAAK